MSTVFKETIELLYKDFKEIDEIVKLKNSLVQNSRKNLKELLDGKTPEEAEDALTYIYVDSILYNSNLQTVFVRLMHYIELFKTVTQDSLNEEIEQFYKDMKQWMPKSIFKAVGGELVEVETGMLDKSRKAFLESEELKYLKERFVQN